MNNDNGIDLSWKFWLRMSIFFLMSHYIPMLAAIVFMFVGELFLWLVFGALTVIFRKDVVRPSAPFVEELGRQ